MTDLEGRLRVSHSDDGERSRAAVFFRIILLIPHLIWFTLWSIGAVVVLPIHWVGALILGRSMGWAHSFYAAFVRYALHLYSYWYFAADKYPPFVGDPGYVVDAEIPPPGPQRRLTIAFRLFLALPALILAFALTNGIGGGGTNTSTSSSSGGGSDPETAISTNFGLAFMIAFLAWFASLALGRTPQGLRDAQVYCLGYATQAYAYLLLLTERYPTSDPRAVPLEPMPAHPIRMPEPEDDLARNRLTVFFRLLLVFPHFVWLVLWGLVAFLAAMLGWFATLATGRLPGGLHRFLAAYVRYWTHVTAFLYVLGGPFPGFVGRAGSYPVDLDIDPPERQSRWKTGFRLILAFPAFLIASAFGTVMFVGGAGAWFCGLFVARVPEGVHRLLGWSLRYSAQAYGYVFFLTDRYPYTGPDGIGRPQPEPLGQGGPETWDLLAPEAP